MGGIYIHIPFCQRKCFYCDFYSIENTSLIPEFVDKLCEEIKLKASLEIAISPIESIFFGGGTPSIIDISMLEKILSYIYKFYSIQNGAEITLECNPGTVNKEILKAYKAMGINRLSFGIQSFIDEELKFLQRIHTAVDAINSFELARDSDFDNISIDLMFSLPVQNLNSWEFTLNKAIKLSPDHISAYSLIYEEGTPLYEELKRGKITPHSIDMDSEFYQFTMNYLEEHGYEQYEVSNYCRNGKKCVHNLNYWYGDEYIGFGPASHSFTNNIRSWNVGNLKKYIELLSKNNLPIEGREELTIKDKLYECVSLQLRAEGIKIDMFKNEFGFNPLKKNKLLDDLIDNNLINFDMNRIYLTKKGYMICDEIVLKLIDLYEPLLNAK